MTTPHDLFRQADKIFADFDKLCANSLEMHGTRREVATSEVRGDKHFEISATKNGEYVHYTIIKKTTKPSKPAWWKFWRHW